MPLIQTYFKDQVKKLTPKERKEIRRQVYERDKGRCTDCDKPVPLYDKDGNFDVFTCGHAAHIIPESRGGPYLPHNLRLKCYKCHIGGEHGPQWSSSEK